MDSDSGFLRVLTKRLDGVGWPHRVLGSPVPPDALVAMRLDALVIDLAVLGPQGGRTWTSSPTCPAPRRRRLHRAVERGPARARAAARGGRLGTKPCHPEEVIARVEAVVRRRRRSGDQPPPRPLADGELEIVRGQYTAIAGGTPLDLTRREFELLELLVAAEGQVLRREEIYERVWGYAMVHGDRSVDVFVRKLRQKLERASPGWRYIHTHFGIGYRFEAESTGRRAVAEPVTA